jgi:hypothetical protein
LIASALGTPGELKEKVIKPHLIEEKVSAYAIHMLLKVTDNGNPELTGYKRIILMNGK